MEKYLILITLHLLGDFYLQTAKVAQCKNARKTKACGDCKKCNNRSWVNMNYLLLHSILYIVPFSILYSIMKVVDATCIIAILLLTHILIDSVTCYTNKRFKQSVVYIVDQIIHIGILCLIPQFIAFNYHIDKHFYEVLKVGFACLTLVMPCSILINKLFKDLYPESNEMGMFDIGSMIGVMERILTFIFACFGSFPAIAIIITVKTWARTNDLKESDFRNKYLLGTLTSLVLSLVIYIVYKSL